MPPSAAQRLKLASLTFVRGLVWSLLVIDIDSTVFNLVLGLSFASASG